MYYKLRKYTSSWDNKNILNHRLNTQTSTAYSHTVRKPQILSNVFPQRIELSKVILLEIKLDTGHISV